MSPTSSSIFLRASSALLRHLQRLRPKIALMLRITGTRHRRTTLHRDYQPLVTSVAIPKPESSSEDPYGLPTGIKKEHKSSDEDHTGQQGQPSEVFREAHEYAPYAPENESEVTLATILSELRAKNECSQLRTTVNQVDPRYVEEWSHVTSELKRRQNGMVNALPNRKTPE